MSYESAGRLSQEYQNYVAKHQTHLNEHFDLQNQKQYLVAAQAQLLVAITQIVTMEKRIKVLPAAKAIKENQMATLIQIAIPVMVAMVLADLLVQAVV